ncbi:MAG TPA: Mut7-C RNAse domain-containing protein [Acidimicrobiales bacterium]|nr:Mut7-C RNAse domain-containing protein [Acidimicrobiales bacterium]
MVCRVEVRLYAELGDLVPPDRRGGPIPVEVAAGTTVKDLAESLGVPHTEIDVILVNGASVGFAHRVADGDRVSLYPTFEGIDVSGLQLLRPRPLRRTRFVLDVHLGRLARDLRLLGFDVIWRNDATDDELARVSVTQGRVLLTRDRGLLKRAVVTRGYLVRGTDRLGQVVEVLRRFDLFDAAVPFARCLECNGLLAPVSEDEVAALLPPRIRREQHDFRRCGGCGRVYWPGSHYDRLAAFVEDVRRAGGGP